ncbi:translation initiation factor eIF3 core subunit b [Rhodotorula paludigena]|uniref:translation initiation factor eIF3 core subunit b n=1 Tax=Rhodotorula paludigena TaxID=86838 RepID=UPI00316B874D
MADGDIDYSDLEQQFHTEYVSPLDSVVILDGAPVVGSDKSDRLLKALTKTAAKEAGVSISPEQIEMPTDESGQSKGFMFISLANPTEAQAFQRAMHGHAFDKRHTFSVIPFTDVDSYANLDDEYAEPAQEEWAPREHFRAWLADPAGRDQIALYRGDDLSVEWANKAGASETAHQRTKWTDLFTQWSPQGTYLATMHLQGVALWGGKSFDRINRFAHPEVKLIDFSSYERYLVTWSPRPIEPATGPMSPFTDEDAGNHLAVWDIVTGALVRTFPMVGVSNDPNEANKRIVWPMFKWSPDEKYVARVTPGQQISVYETPSMAMLGKKSIKIDGVVDFEWAPMNDKEREALEAERNGLAKPGSTVRENKIAFWTPEIANQPARVSLMNLPSRTIIRSKNLFNVHDCKIHWQSNGDYLCVKVDRHTKTGKTKYTNLELFRLREKDCPVQVVELKDAVVAFAWEPQGSRFGLITTADPNYSNPAPGTGMPKTALTFYAYDQRKGDFLPLKTFADANQRTSNNLFWSPKGRHVVAATLGSTSKFDVDFFDLDLDRPEGNQQDQLSQQQQQQQQQSTGDAIRLVVSREPFGTTDIEWDPSGRYVATYGSTWMGSLEAGFAIWDFKGENIQEAKVDKFKQLLWRPRPPTLLSREQQRAVRKNLREYSRQFEEQDELDAANENSELVERRQRLLDEWNAWRSECLAALEQRRNELGRPPKASLVKAAEGLKEEEEVEEIVEEVIEEKTEIVE